MLTGKYWAIYDFIDHRGQNAVVAALDGFPVNAKAAINAFITFIEVTPPPFDRRLVKPLRNRNGERGKGLSEFRIANQGVQYRPIIWYGPNSREHEIVILAVAIEKNGRFVPHGIIDTCWTRVSRIQNHEAQLKIHSLK